MRRKTDLWNIFTLALILLVFASSILFVFAGISKIKAQNTPTPDTATVSLATPTAIPVIVADQPPNPIPTNDPTEPPATTPETLLGQLFALLKDGTYMLWAAAGVVVIVGAIKTVAGAFGIAIQGNGAIFLTLVVQVLIWLGYAVANYFDQGETFKAWYLQIIDVIRSLLPLFGAIFLGHMGFQAAAKRSVPVLGYTASRK